MLQSKHRPASVTILALFVLSLSAWNGLRLGSAIATWKILAEYGAQPLYIATSGGFWLIAGILLFGGLWRGIAWARKMAYITAAGYTSWYWCDRLFMQTPHANWPFALAVTIILLSFTLITLLQRGSIVYFGKT